MIFVDTNYFLRFFLGDQVSQHEEAKALFQRAAKGEAELGTSAMVFFEVYWVATSFYAFHRENVAEFLHNILKMEFIDLENRDLLTQAVLLYADTSYDLEDAYNLAYARSIKAKAFATFDKKLQRKFWESLKQ